MQENRRSGVVENMGNFFKEPKKKRKALEKLNLSG